mgnify:CR=1 FL=1
MLGTFDGFDGSTSSIWKFGAFWLAEPQSAQKWSIKCSKNAQIGIANALVCPAVWPLTLEGLGRHTKTASALLIMAIAGGAIIPPLYGQLVDRGKETLIEAGVSSADALATSAQESYYILIPCYLIIFIFAVSAKRLRN